MDAVNHCDSRIVGRTSFDAAASCFNGKRTFTARGRTRFVIDWLTQDQSLPDRSHRHPQASGHGHRS